MRPTSHFTLSLHSLRSRAKNLGFTLVELLVVVGIMVVITAMILARYSQFNGVVLLRNLAFDVGLSIREAQVYSISGKGGTGGAATRFGLYATISTPNQYFVFQDSNNNTAYDSGEAVQTFTMRSGYAVQSMCATRTDSVERCTSTGDFTSLTITFIRPDPDATIKTGLSETYTKATITLVSPSGATRYVIITNTGQISVQSS